MARLLAAKATMLNKLIKQQLGHLKRNLASIDVMIACAGSLLTAEHQTHQKLLVVSEQVRQQTNPYHADSSSIPIECKPLSVTHQVDCWRQAALRY